MSRNNLPIEGWHRSVASYRAPCGRELKSRNEVLEWLAQRNAAHLIDRFDFEGVWERPPGDVLKFRVGPLQPSNDVYVEWACGTPIRRSFEFVDAPTFRFTHFEFLRGLRASVVADIERQCIKEKERRHAADATWRAQRLTACRSDLDVATERLQPSLVRLLYDADATPHRVTDGVFRFPLLDPDYCASLALHGLAFRASTKLAGIDPLVNDVAAGRVSLDKLGLTQSVTNALLSIVVRPLAARLFPALADLDHHVAFLAVDDDRPDYAATDDADVCLDVCLDATPGHHTRTFHGSIDDPVFPPVRIEHATVGDALLYRRNARHRRLPGEHVNLVLWCRSSSSRGISLDHLTPPATPRESLVVVLPTAVHAT